jgi:hypothetical protein
MHIKCMTHYLHSFINLLDIMHTYLEEGDFGKVDLTVVAQDLVQ